jgi:hypothetical protein
VHRVLRKEKLVGYREREENSGGLSAECRGWELRDREGEKIGKVDEVFVDDNDRPEYLGVKMGLLGGKLTLIPADIVQAGDEGRLIEVSASRDRVKDAPSLGSNEEITAERERGIRDHFGLDSGSSESAQQGQDGDTSEIPPGYRRDSGEDQETRASNQDAGSDNERQGEEGGATGEREPWTDSGDSSTDSSSESAGAAAGGTAAGYAGRDREGSGETEDERQSRSGGSSTGSGNWETMRVSVWREKARAEKVLGDDGGEEVRIRKQWVEEEDIVEVEDRRQG